MVTVSFPGLGIGEFSFNKVAFTIPIGSGIEVRWYGIIMVCGIILAFLYANYRRKQEGISFDDLLDYAIFTVISGVIGARLYYIINSGQKYEFLEIFQIWKGGIAIYGAIIGGAISLLCVSLYKKIKWTKAFDMVCPGVMIGQIVGRWGNFFNGEAYGVPPVEGSWLYGLRMELLHEGWANPHVVQPAFLYESVWNLIGFIIINLFYKNKKYDGQVFLMYITWYGFGRMFIEGLRIDSLMQGKIRVSQFVAMLCFVVGTVLLITFAIKFRKKPLPAVAADEVPSAYGEILSEMNAESTPEEAKAEAEAATEPEAQEENSDVGNTD